MNKNSGGGGAESDKFRGRRWGDVFGERTVVLDEVAAIHWYSSRQSRPTLPSLLSVQCGGRVWRLLRRRI